MTSVKKRLRRFTVLAALLVASFVVVPTAAGATTFSHFNSAFYCGSAGYNGEYFAQGGYVNINLTNTHVSRGVSGFCGYQVCDYQASTIVQIVSGYAYYDYSSFHSGCSWAAWFDWLGTGEYPCSCGSSAWWYDDKTDGAFKKIAQAYF